MFIWCPVSDVCHHLKTSFCHFSQIWPLNWSFKPWNLVFRKRWWWIKLFDMMRGTFYKRNLFIPCPISDIWRHLYMSYCWYLIIVSLDCSFKHSNVFFGVKMMMMLFNMTKETFWEYSTSCTIPLFHDMTSWMT